MRKSTEDFIILLALGFEFIGIVGGGIFIGYIAGKFLNLRRGTGEAVGTLLGLVIAALVAMRILTFYIKSKRK